MKSNKQKRQELVERRKLRRLTEDQLKLTQDLKSGRVIPVDRTKIVSRSVLPRIPDFYRDKEFTCKNCGTVEIWTAKKQKWWYEEAGGEIETIAIKCRKCRETERIRKETVRQMHLAGVAKKQRNKKHS